MSELQWPPLNLVGPPLSGARVQHQPLVLLPLRVRRPHEAVQEGLVLQLLVVTSQHMQNKKTWSKSAQKLVPGCRPVRGTGRRSIGRSAGRFGAGRSRGSTCRRCQGTRAAIVCCQAVVGRSIRVEKKFWLLLDLH